MRLDSSIAIVAVGATAQGKLPGRTADDIAIEALGRALEEAQLGKDQIDGLITCKSDGADSGIDTEIGRKAGMNPAFSATLDYGSCNFSLHLAAMAIKSGMAKTVACVYGTNQRTGRRNEFARPMADAGTVGAPYGFAHIAGPAALAFRRHQELYGTTEEQLGHIVVASRQWAKMNPQAIFREAFSLDDYFASPALVRPLRRADVTMISDGGAALIVTSADAALDYPKRPAYLLAGAQQTGLRLYQNADHLMRPWIRQVADRVYADAGISADDVDVLFIQDPTSVWILQMLEWYGFCGVGEAGPFVGSGAIAPAGAIPVNTNGGQLSEAYMWGWLHLVEAVRQLRGECGERQVADAKIALYCSTKGFEKAAATVLASEPRA
jgi:acetyl-CoA acetyltransferase